MNRGVHWADRLARRVFAVLAKHRLRHHLWRGIVRICADEVAVETEPVHLAPHDDLLLAHDRHIVLGLTRHDASVAAGAGIQIDCHRPLVRRIQRRMAVERDVRLLALMHHKLCEIRLLAELRERSFAHERATLHAPVLLRDREGVFLARRTCSRAGCEVRRRGRPQLIGIEAGEVSNRAAAVLAISKRNSDRAVGVTWDD